MGVTRQFSLLTRPSPPILLAEQLYSCDLLDVTATWQGFHIVRLGKAQWEMLGRGKRSHRGIRVTSKWADLPPPHSCPFGIPSPIRPKAVFFLVLGNRTRQQIVDSSPRLWPCADHHQCTRGKLYPCSRRYPPREPHDSSVRRPMIWADLPVSQSGVSPSCEKSQLGCAAQGALRWGSGVLRA